MPQAVTIGSLPRAFELVKGMQAQKLEWGEGYRALGREAIAAILQGQMGQALDEHLERTAVLDEADRRNGSYRRHLLTELGDLELAVPRTRIRIRTCRSMGVPGPTTDLVSSSDRSSMWDYSAINHERCFR